jgi:hypothetical protein
MELRPIQSDIVRVTSEDHINTLQKFSTIESDYHFLLNKEVTTDPAPRYEPGTMPAGDHLHIACLIPELFGLLKQTTKRAPSSTRNNQSSRNSEPAKRTK